METFLVLNGYDLNASIDEQEQIILSIASGRLHRKRFTDWVKERLVKVNKA